MVFMSKKEITTIKISKELREKLKTLGGKGETYEDIIWRLLEKSRIEESKA